MRASAAVPLVLQPCVDAVSAAAAGFERRRGIGEVHKLRVAIRRTRTALTVFGQFLPAHSQARVQAELRRLQRRIGIVRDLDVFVGGSLQEHPGNFSGAGSMQKVLRRREKAAQRSAADFGGRRFRKLTRQLQAFAAVADDAAAVRHAAGGNATDDSIGVFADAVLHRYYRGVEKRCKAGSLDSRNLHVLRIRVKNLRYVAEFFRELYAVRPMQRFLSALTALQDQLGELHDLVRAQAILADLRGERKTRVVVVFAGREAIARLGAAESAACAAAGVIGVEQRNAARPSRAVPRG